MARHKYTESQAIAAFWNKVKVGAPEECWPWLGKHSSNGYGYTQWRGRKQCTAHRMAFILAGGYIEEGECICHKCDTPKCCNPNHLFAGTIKENAHDAMRKGRIANGERSGTVKLTDAQVADIRRLRIEGMTYIQIANQFQIDQSHVGKIVRGESRRRRTDAKHF